MKTWHQLEKKCDCSKCWLNFQNNKLSHHIPAWFLSFQLQLNESNKINESFKNRSLHQEINHHRIYNVKNRIDNFIRWFEYWRSKDEIICLNHWIMKMVLITLRSAICKQGYKERYVIDLFQVGSYVTNPTGQFCLKRQFLNHFMWNMEERKDWKYKISRDEFDQTMGNKRGQKGKKTWKSERKKTLKMRKMRTHSIRNQIEIAWSC